MGKKPVMATQEDVNKLASELSAKIEQANQSSQQGVQAAEKRLQDALRLLETAQTMSEQDGRAAIAEARMDSRSYTEECVQGLSEVVNNSLLPPLESQIKDLNQELSNKINELDMSTRNLLKEEMSSLCTRFDDEIGRVKEESDQNLHRWAAEAAEALVQQRREIDSGMDKHQRDLQTHMQDSLDRFTHATEFERVMSDQRKTHEKLDERNNIQHAEIYVDIGLTKESLEEARTKAHSDITRVAAQAATALDTLSSHCKDRLTSLEKETQRLAGSVSLVESFTTKRVEWVIQSASQRLKAEWGNSGTKLHTGWFSPKFDAGGCYGLQLELQLFRVTEDQLSGKQELGNLAAFLWACKGTTVVYKIYIGNKSMVLEKTFNGRVPYGTPRMCWLHEQINKEDDTLRVGIEILEAVREIEHPIKAAPVLMNTIGHDTPAVDAANTALVAAKQAVEGSMFFKRYINNRLLDQVHSEVELMRSRMVRKIEWRVQQAWQLRTCFQRDEAICSPHFRAAGVDQLQFVLYPSGHSSATEGFCSLFIYGPMGATLRCQLSIGKQIRNIAHSFDASGAVGRTNFCQWDAVIEAEDVVYIRLEIEEAQQDMQATTLHADMEAGDRRTLGQANGNDRPGIESVVKLTRAPGARHAPPYSAGPGLEDQLVLPCLWTAKRLGDGAHVPDGFQHFDDLRGQTPARPNTAVAVSADANTRPTSAARPGSAVSKSGCLRRNASLPACRPQSGLRRN